MLGFATVDNQTESSVVAIWLTSQTSPTAATHTNAVRVELREDPDAFEKVHALTRDRILLLTDGSAIDGLPLEGYALKIDDLEHLAAATESLRLEVGVSVRPAREMNRPAEDTPTLRALESANYLAGLWSDWLEADNARRKRWAKHEPREPEAFPAEFIKGLDPQPVRAFNA
ncbi:hypothetical protein [Aeromicrobium sp. Root495]|uniref:hypothetical protein n=1 Tax=Aeromicrobium sp. Root495 TaxID=1736550 RepID=UPI0012E990DD|nr:hypothetical protein [Aeromicrobium sp. Root495]